MLKFRKDHNFKVVSVILSILFFCNSSLYSYPDSKDTLRLEVGQGDDTYDRINEAIKTHEDNEKFIDPNIQCAHREKRVKLFHIAHPEVIEEVHEFLIANGLSESVPLFEELQKQAAIEVKGWDKGGLWLVTPKKGEPLPPEHASDRGGIHIVDFPGQDLTCSYVHGIAAYLGFSHDEGEFNSQVFEEAFARWNRDHRETLSDDFREEFLKRLEERKANPRLLTDLSETQRRDYALFRRNAPNQTSQGTEGSSQAVVSNVLTDMELTQLRALGWIDKIGSSFDLVQEAMYAGKPLYGLRFDSERMLKSFFEEQGFDIFIKTMEYYYRRYSDPRMKRFISGEINIILLYFDMGIRGQTLTKEMLEPYLDFIVDISLAPAKRVLNYMITKAINQSPSGKVMMYQNLRLGGIYPIMEKDMCDLLASKGFPVFEINLQDISVDGRKMEEMEDYEIEAYMDKLKTNPEFIKARIILVRFKVSSLGEDYIGAESQRGKFKALATLSNKDIPIVMVDGSAREISLAQQAVMKAFPEFKIEMFNADPVHLGEYSVYFDVPDNIDILLPAATPSGTKGSLYDTFARRMAMTLASDEVFWREIDSNRTTVTTTDTPTVPRNQTYNTIEEVITIPAERVIRRTTREEDFNFRQWVANQPANKAVVVIVMDKDEYEAIKEFADIVHIRVVEDGEGIDEIIADLKEYQIIEAQYRGEIINLFGTFDETNGFPFEIDLEKIVDGLTPAQIETLKKA